MKTFDCACGVCLEADADDDLLVVALETASRRRGIPAHRLRRGAELRLE